MTEVFTVRVRSIVGGIPSGMITTYGLIAECAGNRSGARQVARILYSSSNKYQLPWHRVVNRSGLISTRSSGSHLLQRQLLEEEGVVFGDDGRIDFSVFLWLPVWEDY